MRAKGGSVIAAATSSLVAGALTTGCLDISFSEPVVQPDSILVVQAESLSRAFIIEENTHVGDTAWNRTLLPASPTELAAFLDRRSAFPGDTLRFFGISQDSTLTVRLYRVGWYRGAGARLILNVGAVSVPTASPCAAPLPGPAECLWPQAALVPLPSDAPPGVYVVRYTNSRGAGRIIPLVVRQREQTGIAVVLSFNTYQAYNNWGGASLYPQPNGTPRASRVSFLRPYADDAISVRFVMTDLPLVRFLEQRGYPVSYVADWDLDRDDNVAFGSRLLIISGQSEYWSARMRKHAELLRDSGVGLAFFGANDSYFQIRYEGPHQGYHGDVLVCYKSGADPLIGDPFLATVRFRDPPVGKPENALIGIMAVWANVGPFVRLRVTDNGPSFFAGTGFQIGDSTTPIGGWEGDRVVDNGLTPAGLQVMFAASFPVQNAQVTDAIQTTFYRSQSGAGVFGAGTVAWNWALDDLRPGMVDPRLQRFVANLLDSYLR